MDYDPTLKTVRMTTTRDAVADGTLEIQAANDTPLAIFDLSATGGTVAGDVWTLAFASGTVAGQVGAGAGTAAAKAVIKDTGGTARVIGLSVGGTGSNADIVFDNVNIAEGQSVSLSAATITHG